MRPRTSSVPIATTIDSAVRSHPSRIPNERFAPTRMLVIRIGGRNLFASRAIGFFHVMPDVAGRTRDRLSPARRPANHDAIDRAGGTQPVVQPSLILRAEPCGSGHLLCLHVPVPVKLHARTDRAVIAPGPFELELDPVAFRRDTVLVDEK